MFGRRRPLTSSRQNRLCVGPAWRHMTLEMLRRKGTWEQEASQRWASRVTLGAGDSQPTQAATAPVLRAEVKAKLGETHKPGRPGPPAPREAVSPACSQCPRTSSARLCSALRGRREDEPTPKEMHKRIYPHNGLNRKNPYLQSVKLGVSLPRLGCACAPTPVQHTEAPHSQGLFHVFTPFPTLQMEKLRLGERRPVAGQSRGPTSMLQED